MNPKVTSISEMHGFQPRVQEAVHREDVAFEKLKVWISVDLGCPTSQY